MASGRRAVAGLIAIEELDAVVLFQRAHPAKHRRMVDIQRCGGSFGRATIHDGKYEPKIVPIRRMHNRTT